MKFFSTKDNTPVGFGPLPNLPKDTPQPSAAGNDFTPLHKSKKGINKKIVVGFGVVLSFLVVGLTAFIATRSQPQTTKSKAAATDVVIGISDVVVSKDSSGMGVNGNLNYLVPTPGAPGVINVNWKVNLNHCDSAGVTNCSQAQPVTFTESKAVPMDGTKVPYSHSFSYDGALLCGTYQLDAWVDTGAGYPPDANAGADIYHFASDCAAPGTPTPTPSGILTPTSTPSPTPTQSPSLARIAGRVALYDCNAVTDPPPKNSCSPVNSAYGLNGEKVFLTSGGADMGSDTSHTYVDGTKGYFEFNNLNAGTYTICSESVPNATFYCGVPTQSPGNCSTFNVLPNENATSKYLVFQTNASTCSPLSSPTPSSSITPPSLGTPPPTATPTPIVKNTLTPTPSPTNTVVVITATPTPTTIIVVGATNTPGPTTIVQSTSAPQPSIPSAGSPLPYIAVAIPFVLILIAFVL